MQTSTRPVGSGIVFAGTPIFQSLGNAPRGSLNNSWKATFCWFCCFQWMVRTFQKCAHYYNDRCQRGTRCQSANTSDLERKIQRTDEGMEAREFLKQRRDWVLLEGCLPEWKGKRCIGDRESKQRDTWAFFCECCRRKRGTCYYWPCCSASLQTSEGEAAIWMLLF